MLAHCLAIEHQFRSEFISYINRIERLMENFVMMNFSRAHPEPSGLRFCVCACHKHFTTPSELLNFDSMSIESSPSQSQLPIFFWSYIVFLSILSISSLSHSLRTLFISLASKKWHKFCVASLNRIYCVINFEVEKEFLCHRNIKRARTEKRRRQKGENVSRLWR